MVGSSSLQKILCSFVQYPELGVDLHMVFSVPVLPVAKQNGNLIPVWPLAGKILKVNSIGFFGRIYQGEYKMESQQLYKSPILDLYFFQVFVAR